MPFEFNLDDILDFDETDDSGLPGKAATDAVVRNYKQSSPTNLRTTASDYGYANQQISITNIGSLMMGVPLYKDPETSTSQQEFLISSLLGSSLTSGEEDSLGAGFDELVPSDIKEKTANDRSKNGGGSSGGSTDDTATDGTTTDVSAISGEVSSAGYIWPLQGSFHIGSGFGPRKSPGGIGSTNHKGIDLGVPKGTKVYAAKGGTVHRKKEGGENGTSGAGWYIRMEHEGGAVTQYFHLSKYIAADGAKVPQGALIAESGGDGSPGSGSSTGAHLHFEIRPSNNVAVNPIPLLPPKS